jgi:hypothetical protein
VQLILTEVSFDCGLCIALELLLSDMNSSGFCLINNVAIGAAYAKARYGRSSSNSSSSSNAKVLNGGAHTVNGCVNDDKHEPRVSRIAIVDFDIHVSDSLSLYIYVAIVACTAQTLHSNCAL